MKHIQNLGNVWHNFALKIGSLEVVLKNSPYYGPYRLWKMCKSSGFSMAANSQVLKILNFSDILRFQDIKVSKLNSEIDL